MTLRHNRRIRGAFTLTEMMVAMAISIGIMWILAESFKMGLDFTRYARSTGSMMSQLDGARAVIARDLLAEHFYPDDNLPAGTNRGVRLSDQRFDLLNNAGQGWSPPKGGFFRIISPTPGTLLSDPNGYSMNTAVNHALHFTSILPMSDQQPYSVNSPAGGSVSYQSRAAEIGLFLVDSGKRTSPGPSGLPLYYLVRRLRLVAMTTDDVYMLSPAVADGEVIASNGTNIFTLADLTNPSNRMTIGPSTVPGPTNSPLTFGITNNRYGEDMLLDNVLSFEVMVDWAQSSVANSTNPPRSTLVGNWDSPFDFLSANAGKNPGFTNAGVFDTWYPVANWNNFGLANNNSALPLAIRVKAIQITLRIFDPKTKQARQTTARYAQ